MFSGRNLGWIGFRRRGWTRDKCNTMDSRRMLEPTSCGITHGNDTPNTAYFPAEDHRLLDDGFVRVAQSRLGGVSKKRDGIKEALMRFQKSNIAFTSNIYTVHIKGKQHRALMSLHSGDMPNDQDVLPQASTTFLQSNSSKCRIITDANEDTGICGKSCS